MDDVEDFQVYYTGVEKYVENEFLDFSELTYFKNLKDCTDWAF